jgi:uncharacterized membrane protein (DUF373 family)
MKDDKSHILGSGSKVSLPGQQNTDHKHNHASEDFLATFSSYWLDRADTIIYAIVGTSFLLGALCALGYSFWYFDFQMTDALTQHTMNAKFSQIAPAIIQFVSDLLLVLIIMEVLGTVLHYLKAHATSLRPFLFIGIVSATRSILSIGARLSIAGSSVDPAEFTRAMIELGVSAAVVLALGVTIKLLGKQLEDNASGT